MAYRPEHENLYQAGQQFRDLCLVQDRSLLWPDQNYWTSENLSWLKTRVVDNYQSGSDRNFKQKLEFQMQDASPAAWGILADMLYIYAVPSSSNIYENKKSLIEWAARSGGLFIPEPQNPVWLAIRRGYTSTGQYYNQKINQITFFILLSLGLKKYPDRQSLAHDRLQFQEFLDSFPVGQRSVDMRHALLYLLFPNDYEDIINSGYKRKIIDYYNRELGLPSTPDIDSDLLKIRTRLTELSPDRSSPINLYDPPYDEWNHPITIPPTPQPTPEPMPTPPPADSMSEDTRSLLETLSFTHNAILYGPPGTGKTYIARQAAQELAKSQLVTPLSKELVYQRAISDLKFYEVLALALYQSGPNEKLTVIELAKQPFVQARYQIHPVQNPQPSIWNGLQSHTSPESATVNVATRSEPFLFDKDNQAKWHLTPEGKNYVEERLADTLSAVRETAAPEATSEDFIRWITFHQSYSYEDFIEGLRPVISEDDSGKIGYEVSKGVFRKICDAALADSGHKYVLVIDEINRGNIAKIMGELITLLEDDKRVGNPTELSLQLPYSGDKLRVPANLYIIGTMNTADRSIALLDVALRRRFAFVEVMPRPELLQDVVVKAGDTEVALDAVLKTLNNRIRAAVGRDFQLGHSYFLKVAREEVDKRPAMLEFVWNRQILPLLQEYFFSRREKLFEILAEFIDEENRDTEDLTALKTDEIEDLVTALFRIAQAG